ncbi:putative pyridoxal phosphate-dependent protein CysK2 [Mycobacterium kubicae]|uniref:PLP-dependent cysteine synthase family protein n=1 Tax=Mycobacterium kubicae TaxID=120959 RepID=A0AAX1JCR1_9MYCO|nr:PLP-dependent cysteine synthase family protein [Mycobacterium kubicae]MCV7095376.1 PLP-dependent cysteine synthase family protein [Mycobacterium kubicae]QNI04988.1 PLP-dependent cysteine synthase family protein [Mycobacterium kubicae]QNI04995.1 PLP-dependent cysteine synthase family protein [Mycobacterium kubicae]QNI09989.1 PLP-dependent cysteine synthase family protein [Mycobacterium kubicae]QPI38190.1 PLP-dependent cysteine synthase family protein [Mycobacterium kubicae]
MTDVLSFDNYVHPIPALKVVQPRECARAGTDTYRRPGAMVGHTPVLRIEAPFAPPGRGFWAKLEGFNPGGSMKDRPAMHMVEAARARGELAPGARIVESTSGSLGLGLALAGQAYGHPVTVVTDTGMEPIVRHMLAAYGADVELVTEPHPVGGWQQARKDRVAQLLAAHPGSWCPDQYSNPDNITGYRSLALELLDQLGGVDVLVCSVGTGGHSAGVARVLREFNPAMKLIGVDTIGSTIFGQPVASRLMRGLGSSIYPRNIDYAAFDEVHWVAPQESVWACRTLAASNFASGGWSVGAVALVAGWAARTFPQDTRIAAVFPDGPQRYFDTIYNDDYCHQHQLLDWQPVAEPAVITDPTQQVVTSWTRTSTVVNPALIAAA